MANEDPENKKKPHRQPHSGRKAEKKSKKKKVTGEKQPNPKAFAINSVVKAERRFRRTQDLAAKKQHVPLVDRTPVEPPPVVVAVVGPPKVGKSTLIQCLIRNFTRQPLTTVKGPVTVVSGKKRRITIMECNNDINCMIDIAKVADLVLLLVDASFGFEMEIFEFLNICQVHGMPRVMGVLTHLDMLKHSKQLKRVKKTLKHRFWTEVYAGAKLFYLSALLHGEYLRHEVKNLGRFISVMKFRPLIWRTSHPYLLVDRLEDITSPEIVRQNPVVDREVCLYGFVRGIPLNKNYGIHIPGCGDFKIIDVTYLPDPCPLPEKEKRRSLIEKEKLIYAPFSGVGGIVYDKDAVYIELADRRSHFQERKPSELVTSLMDVQEPLDKKMIHSELQLFSGAEPITSADIPGQSSHYHEESVYESGRKRRKVVFETGIEGTSDGDDSGNDSDSDEGKDDDGESEDDEYSGKDYESEEEEELDDKSEVENKAEAYKNVNLEHSKLISKEKKRQRKKYIWEDRDDEDTIISISTGTEAACQNDSSSKSNDAEKKTGYGFTTHNGTSEKHQKRNRISDANTKLRMAMGDLDEEISEGEISSEEIQQENNQSIPPTEKVRIHKKHNVEVTNKISECLAELEKKSGKNCFKTAKKNAVSFSEDESDSSSDEMHDDSVVSNDDKGLESDESASKSVDENKIVEHSAVQWKSNLTERAANAFLDRQANSISLWKLVYGQEKQSILPDKVEDQQDDDLGGLFRRVTQEQKEIQEERDLQNGKDNSKTRTSCGKDWSNPQTLESIVDCFVTGKWKESEDAEELLRLDDASVSDESEVYGDFEDMETGEKHAAKIQDEEKSQKEPKDRHSKDLSLSKTELIEKKKKLKAKFDAEYDEGEGEVTYYDELKQEVSRQAEINKSEFEGMDDNLRVQLEGFRPGMYVRVELSHVPCELVTNFDATYPLIIGGLLSGEENVGYVQVRIKKHRWYNRTLKNCDPLIVSLGWRRFQTIPVFAKLEDNLRQRMLKYTPEHITCMAHFWGPITPQGSGFLAVQNVANKEPGFRIAVTGSVVELDKSVQIMKKLKLTGAPIKIYKKTAFVRGMFNSSLEVAKFEGAKLRTVSGIRGQIKRALGKPEGSFRATFEDKILLSDIVFCRTWYRVEIPRLYNPVMSLLLPSNQKNVWQGMKTVGQLKREQGIRSEPAKDSLYTPIHREPKVFAPLIVPSKLQKMLPYTYKPKVPVRVSRRQQVENTRIAVVRDVHEQKVAHLMDSLKTSYDEKHKRDQAAVAKKKAERKKLLEREEMKQLKRHKELRKQVFRTLEKMEQKKKAQANTRTRTKTKR